MKNIEGGGGSYRHTKSLNRQILLAKHYRFNYELERSIQDRIKE